MSTTADGSGLLAGHPAVTPHAHGEGQAYYLATRPAAEDMDRLLRQACADAGVEPALEAPLLVEAVRRGGDGASLLFLLNHADAEAEITAPAGVDLLTGEPTQGRLRLAPGAVAVIREGAV